MKDFIQKQFEQKRIFKIVEIGAGVPVASRILCTPGASKILWETSSPYSSAKKLFQIDSRMVSKEAVETIINKTPKEDFNTLVVTSFQIPSEEKIVSHGWIGIWSLEFDHPIYLHVTLNSVYGKDLSRQDCIEKIGDIVLELISSYDNWQVKMKDTKFGFVDNIIFRDYILDSYQLLSQQFLNTLVCFDEGIPVRFENVSRKYSQINMYKGSFNPVHSAHLEIAKIAESKFENSRTFFAISRNTFGKGIIEEKELYKRINRINMKGYPVLVFDNGFVYDNFQAIQKRFSGNVMPIMGADTFNRFMNCWNTNDLSQLEHQVSDWTSYHSERGRLELGFEECFGKANFLVFGRTVEIQSHDFDVKFEYVDFDMNISSTMIREGILKS